MDISNGRLGYTLELNNAPFLNALRESNRAISEFNLNLRNNFNQSTVSVNNLAIGVGAFLSVDAAKNFINQMVKIRSEFEQTEISFNTMLQSQEKGNALMQEMIELAKNTPLQFSEVSKGAKQLLAYQVEAEKLTGTLSMLGDISSGLDVPLSRLILVYGQVKAKGKLMGDDLRQFTEAGVPMIAMIAKNMGVAQSAVAEMVSEGKVGFKDVEKVLKDLTDQGGLFYNMMENKSKTISGQIAKLQDEIEQMFNKIGTDSQEFITDVISGASYVVEHYQEIGKVLGILIATYGVYKAALIATIALQRAQVILGNVQAFLQLATSIRSAKDAQLLFNMAVSANPYAIAAAALAGLIAVLYNLNSELSHAEKMQNNISEATENATKSVKSEQDELNRLIAIAKDENLSKEARLRAIKKINEISPQYLGNLNLENINTQLAVKAVDAYSTALLKNAKAKAFQAKYDEIVNKRIEASSKGADQYINGVNSFFMRIAGTDKELKQLKNYSDVLDYVTRKEGESLKTKEAITNRAKEIYNIVGLDKKHLEVSQYDAQLIDLEKELIKSQADIEKVVTEIDQTVSGDKKKTKSKKEVDPFEVYKKQIESVKEDYERFVNYMNSDDLVLKNSGKIQYETLSKSGATYEEFLRRLQKQLVNTSNKSVLQVKQLQFINDELFKTIGFNAFDKFKEGIEDSITESENLLEVLGKIQEEKLKLQGKTDQISVDKLKFLDEKEIENIKKTDDAAKDLIKTLTDEYTPLDAINKKFDEQLFLLKNKIFNANDEVDRLLNESNSLDNSLPENADKKNQIEEKILQIRKQILVTQNAIEQSEKNREKELKNTPTNNTDYNLLLKNYQDFNAQKKTIEDEFETNLKTIRNARLLLQNDNELKLNQSKLDELLKQNEYTENEIVRQKKKSLSKIALEQMKSSESYMKLMTKDLDKMTVESLEKIIEDLEGMLNNPDLGMELSPEDFKVIIDQIRSIKDEVNKAKPWKGISEGWDKLFNSEDSEDKLEGVGMLIDGMNTYFDALKQTIDMADEAIEAFGGNIDDSVKETIQHVQNIVNGVGNAIQGYFSGNYAQMVAGIVQVVVEVAKILGGSKDKRLEKRIKKQQEAVKELKRAYDELSFSIERALGGKEYSMQKDQIKNLQEQKVLMEQMIQNEEKKKKTDRNKINEWKDAISSIDRQIIETQENIANDILQTSAKELASTLGDALAEAFGKGEDAAKSFEKVANDVLKNAVLNQLKKRFIEEELKKALDQLEKDMGVDEKGWNGLSPEEQQDFRDRIKEISQNFQGTLEQYSDLFKDLVDPNENSLSGAIKGVSEETASLIAGQVNAMRLLIVEANKSRIESNKILLQSLDRLANIDANTRTIDTLLNRILNKFDNAGRAYGF
ncbi:tape measure protein [Empedobacter sp. UBA7248]|uniref:tape measure protein n=1 Tax=Empedobacter sp. UBA7248 TaxID=1946448 RepID=UPI0025BC64ED|nr:tape measure protein [Empedobacter sp. UBA7248]